eukprot:4011720-Prymnesium_polylepis.1
MPKAKFLRPNAYGLQAVGVPLNSASVQALLRNKAKRHAGVAAPYHSIVSNCEACNYKKAASHLAQVGWCVPHNTRPYHRCPHCEHIRVVCPAPESDNLTVLGVAVGFARWVTTYKLRCGGRDAGVGTGLSE